MSTVSAFSHVTITVSDLQRSVAWYEAVLGMRHLRDMEGPGWRRALMLSGDVMIGLQVHETTPTGDVFSESRIGLDHLSLACADRAEVEDWAARLDEHGASRGPVSDGTPVVMTGRDPDGIAIEFFARG